jgi:hypothetical protein
MNESLYKRAEELIYKHVPIIAEELSLDIELPDIYLMHDEDAFGYGRFLHEEPLEIEIYYKLLYNHFKGDFDIEFVRTLAHEFRHLYQYNFMKDIYMNGFNGDDYLIETEAENYSNNYISRRMIVNETY